MSDRRQPVTRNSGIKNRGRHRPTPYKTNRNQANNDSEDEDPELKPYVWDPRPKSFKGPTKAQLTERQFNPTSVLPLSPDSQWRNWEAGQRRKEKEHNARMQSLLAERERYRARESDEHKDDADMDHGVEDQYKYQDHPPRRYNPQPARPRKNIRDEEPNEFEDRYEASPPRRYAPQPERRKRPMWDEELDEEAPTQKSTRASKQQKKNDARSQSSYAPSPPRPSQCPQNPTRRSPCLVQEWRSPQNWFCHKSPSGGHELSSSYPRSEQSHPSNPYFKAAGEDRYSHPGQIVPQPPKGGPRVHTSFSPAAAPPRPRPQGTPEPQARMTPDRSSPDLPLFVSQSPRVEESWPKAAVKDECEDRSSLRSPLRSSPTHESRSMENTSGNKDEGPATDMTDLQCLDFKKGILTPIEVVMGASIKDIDVTSQVGAEGTKMNMNKLFSKIELGTKKTLDAPLDDLALVQKKGFLNLKKDYRQAINKVEKYDEEIGDKDREIARLEKILEREERGRR
ncbi:hypothetical protein DL95DRAFT_521600 [Leptodontidium sp. 2 PMI_412]|nr:hypothetical protein DL95DRAFT_521600 [Leptodontidium sp. 2 PMI_412]